MTEEIDRIGRKLDTIQNLLALSLVSNLKRADQIALLDRAGYAPKQIASLLDTTPNTVSVTLSQSRKRRVTTKNQPTERRS